MISKIKQIGGSKFDKILQEKNIDAFNGAQGKILYVLWQGGKMTATEISKKSGLAKTTLTAMLVRMQEQGLVRIEENANDRRSALVCLTEKAAALKDEYQRKRRPHGHTLRSFQRHVVDDVPPALP